MKKIIVVSKNPVKLKASLGAFEKIFPHEKFIINSLSVSSDVGDQPKTSAETLLGASNRVDKAVKKIVGADYYVGIEGGVEENNLEMEAFAWVVIKNKNGKFSKSKTATFFLPPKIAKLIKEGEELGGANDIVFKKTNSKQKNGAVGILTNNVVDRTKLYTEAIILALIPFINKRLYNF